MKKIKIFALVEGKLIDRLSDRVSGTFIRIHYILKYLKKHEDIKLSYIPYQYKQIYSSTYSRINWCIDTFYHFAIPFLSLLIIIFRRPHFIYFSYPNVIYNDSLNIHILRFAKKIGINLLMYSHDWVEQSEIEGRGKNPFSEDIEKELVEISDILVVAFSKYPKFETVLLPGGLEIEEYKSLKYNIQSDRFNIAYTGSLTQGKGIDVLVKAAIRLHDTFPFINLLLFGKDTGLDDKTSRLITKYDFIIHKIVPRTELIKKFSKVDVFVYSYDPNIPYLNFNRPTKFFEYIGSEIPFIATKCEGLKLITDGKGLLWVDYNVDDFCDKIEYLLQNPDERMRLSRELHELKKDNTWKKRADILYEIILNNLDNDVNKSL